MTILVTGAAGNIGRWVVASLQAMGHPFTAAAHRPAQARTVLGGDVDVRELDLHRPETFPAALEGVSSVFMVWPASLTHAARDMGPLVAYMAQRGGIEQVVYSSVEHADTNPRLPHAQVERLVKEAGLPYTFLRPGYFSQNHETFFLKDIRDRNELGAPAGDGHVALLDTRDVGAVAAHMLAHCEGVGEGYWLTGRDVLTHTQIADVFSDVLGRTITYTRPSALSYALRLLREGKAPADVMGISLAFAAIRRGESAHTNHTVEQILGRPPLGFRQYVEDYASVWQH